MAILPGSTIGVLGGGQLGRMFAIAARKMGYRVHTYSPDGDTPAGQVADVEIVAPYEDLAAVSAFARAVAAVTFEFENVPAATAAAAAEHAPVRPSGAVLHTTQNRLREKAFLAGCGVPVAPFAPVRSLQDLEAALARVGHPAVLKTAGWGYDGKGQRVIARPEEAPDAWRALATGEAILEAFVDFELELSVVAARGTDGAFASWGAFENHHRQHILDLTVAPGRIPAAVEREAVEIARGILEALDVEGVLCVEMFLAPGGRLLVNELAPRPHNSGHLTFDAATTSQFEQQLRAVCGLPLGATDLLRPAAMVNLLGDLWRDAGASGAGDAGGADRAPDWAAALAFPAVKLHLYGKAEARPGRKMGHLTALAATPGEAARIALAARAASARGRFSIDEPAGPEGERTA